MGCGVRQVYYAEGEYLHNVKSLAVSTPWRRHWQMGIKGLTYCTHALGPIMRWMKGDRIVRVCCEDAGASSHYADAEGEPFAGDAAVMLAKTEAGRLIKIRVDLTSNRPYGLNFELQGTRGVVEVRNGEGQDNWGQGRIALAAAGQEEVEGWSDLPTVLASDLYDALLPAPYKSGSPEAETALQSGHGGSDYYTTATFIAACRGEGEEIVGIHEAMDMTLPGLASQLSAEKGGEWVDVPDSREWAAAGVASGGGAKL
jgi:predicted dehydrogenase